MYTSVKIHSLSKPQISRLLNHHGVRLQLGGDITVHLTKEQIKKLKRSEKKGGGAVITLDPYQVQQHQHLRNMKGKGTRIEDQGVSSNDIANFLGVQQSSDPMADKQVTINQVKDAGSRIKRFIGLGVKKRGRPKKMNGGDLWDDIGNAIVRPVANAFKPSNIQQAFQPVAEAFQPVAEAFQPVVEVLKPVETVIKPAVVKNTLKPISKQFRRGKIKKALKPVASTLIHQGIPIVTSTLGGIAGETLGGPVSGMAGALVGDLAGQQLANYVGTKTGYGIKNILGLPSKIGVGMGQKQRKQKSKRGSALYNAGYKS